MENITVSVAITGTSNKQKSDIQIANPKKSLYLTPQSLEDEQKLIEFGLTKYTSEDSSEFFVVKSTDIIKLWNGSSFSQIVSDLKSPNYKTVDGVYITVNIIKDIKADNTFYRLNAIKGDGKSIDELIEIVKETNPFE